MSYKEWCEYTQFGRDCDTEKIHISDFIETYSRHKYLQFLIRIKWKHLTEKDTNTIQKCQSLLENDGHLIETSTEKRLLSPTIFKRVITILERLC